MAVLAIEAAIGPPRDWPLAFDSAEYRERVRRVRAEMARSGIDMLYVTSPPNITYLTGYDSRWYRRSTPTGVAIHAAVDRLIFFDDVTHRSLVSSHHAQVGEAAFFRRFRDVDRDGWIFRNTIDDVVDTLRNEGWLHGAVGVEHWATAPGGLSLRYLDERIQACGAHSIDGSWLVDRVRLVKSSAEIVLLEKAAIVADAALEAIAREFQPGMSEIEVQGIAHFAMSRLDGEEPAIRTSVISGPNTRVQHPLPTRRKIAKGDLFTVDLCGSLYRYHANIARTFSVGEPDRRWGDLVARTGVSFDHVVAGIRPGDPMEKAVDIAMRYLDAAGLARHGWFIGGYDLGIAIPPDWVGHTYLNGRCFERADFAVGTVVNFENVLDVPEGWPGGFGTQNVDTLVMEEAGLRILSRLDRGITIV